ncbi:MAG TPA: flagellar basal body P-ring protein FlgI [Nitrospirota bacterium]|nr:flagellar basal body P-ring protein FlgI [Nitrospirota bacterium]
MAILTKTAANRRQQTVDRAYRKRPFRLSLYLFLLAAFCLLPIASHAERIKDIASFEGMRDNQLVGFGLVAGLAGVGDTGNQTIDVMVNMLKRMGATVPASDIKTKDVAAVMITASLPPFPKPGMKLDALVSAIGDAKSLQGGTLLLAPLKGPDGKVYALAQGAVSVGGFIGGGGGTSVQKNHATAGRVPSGVTIENEPPFTLGSGNEIRLFLQRPDFSTATEVARKINEALGDETIAAALDPTTVKIKILEQYQGNLVKLISLVESLEVATDMPALVVINERTGTVTIGENVRISPVAIAHGNLTIEIKTEYHVSQPPPHAPSSAQTVVVPAKTVNVKEQNASLMLMSGATLGEVVRGLNALGVTPRDLVSILQALKAAGALQAEMEII